MIIMKSWLLCLLKYLVKKTGAKNTMQSKKYSIYMKTQKTQQLWLLPPKIQIFEIQNLKNTLLIPVCIYTKSTPWANT